MASLSILPRPARHTIRTHPAAPAVVALLSVFSVLALCASPAEAQVSGSGGPVPWFAPTVDSIVSKVNGPVLDVFDGALQIDVTNARITGADDRFASPVPWSGIPVGSRVLAQVVVPEAIPAVFPPRLPATSVVVFLASSGNLSGEVQAVSVPQGSFVLLYTSVKTNAATEWSGTKADGSAVRGIEDLSAGMQVNVAVTVDPSAITARRVFAYARPTIRIVAFRGRVERIDSAIWMIGGNAVQVNAETKIAGDPKVGDLVDVLEKVVIVPPGMGMPTPMPTAISITKVDANPPRPPERTVEFDGVVESMAQAPTSNAALGHWKISGRDVLVTGLTRVDDGIAIGTAVHVKGLLLPMSVLAPSNSAPQIVATEIRKQ